MFEIFKVRRISDQKIYGRKPRFGPNVYFGLTNKGKVFTRLIDAENIAKSLNKHGHGPVEVVVYECIEKEVKNLETE